MGDADEITGDGYGWTNDGPGWNWWSAEGKAQPGHSCVDLIAEWTDGPVVTETVTKTRIVPGVYGRIEVDSAHGEYVNIRFVTEYGKSSGIWSFREDELDAAAAVLSALAKGLRDA